MPHTTTAALWRFWHWTAPRPGFNVFLKTFLDCYSLVECLCVSGVLSATPRVRPVTHVALGHWVATLWNTESCIDQATDSHTYIYIYTNVNSSHFECTVASKWLRSGFHFEHFVASKCLQSSHFERTVVSKWLKWPLCMASKWLQSSHVEHIVAAKWLLSSHFEYIYIYIYIFLVCHNTLHDMYICGSSVIHLDLRCQLDHVCRHT